MNIWINANLTSIWQHNLKWYRRIYDEVKSQLHDLKITKPIKLHITWIEENRKRDVDNVYSAVKYILDALVKAEVLQNDNAKRVKDISNEIIYADTSEVIVEIEELEDDLYEIKRLHRVLWKWIR